MTQLSTIETSLLFSLSHSDAMLESGNPEALASLRTQGFITDEGLTDKGVEKVKMLRWGGEDIPFIPEVVPEDDYYED